jgi:glycosyltransferase involved in cell wall biosynthesis
MGQTLTERAAAFIVNGAEDSAMGRRARGLARGLDETWQLSFLYRPAGGRLQAALSFFRELRELRPRLLYVLDMAAPGVAAALPFRLIGATAVVIDTGDEITALARSAQLRGSAGVAGTWLLEECGLKLASHIVVRGFFHQELLTRRGIASTWIPDGFERELFYPPAAPSSRNSDLCIGLVGSVIWNGSLDVTYGYDLVELVARLADLPVRGVLVGDGSGLERLRAHAQARGVIDRITFAGRVPYPELRPWLHSFDVALSTQTNDLVGQVRTTGKLPLYLACGCFLLASRVGEAARVLPEEMLVDYDGARDPHYPSRAAAHLRDLVAKRTPFRALGLAAAERLAHNYVYDRLSLQLASLVARLAPTSEQRRSSPLQ